MRSANQLKNPLQAPVCFLRKHSVNNEQNPYAAPTTADLGPATGGPLSIPADDLRKVEAVIKDAGQFWLAILMCFVCSIIGMVLIGPWYLVRLMQWSRLSKTYPQLMDPNVSRGSLPQKFQSSQWKLLVGLIVGLLLGVLVVGVGLLSALGAA